MADDIIKIFEIDPLALDKEWLGQPALYFKYSSDAAEKKQLTDMAKAAVDVTKAEVARDVRLDPDQFDIDKLTEATVKEAVDSDSRVIAAVRNLSDVRYNHDIAMAAVTALDHRKKALENAVYLHGQRYYSEPTAIKGSEDAVESIRRAARKEKKRKKDKKGKQQ